MLPASLVALCGPCGVIYGLQYCTEKNMGGPGEITFASRDKHFPERDELSHGDDERYMDTGSAELYHNSRRCLEAITVVDDVPQLILRSLL